MEYLSVNRENNNFYIKITDGKFVGNVRYLFFF